MKATFLTSVFAVLVATANVNANNVKVYSNVEANENGVNKEYVVLDEATSMPVSKSTYNYDENGKIQDKTTSTWEDGKGWVNAAKYEYQYGKSGKVSSVAYTKWDDKAGRWASNSDLMVNIYNEDGDFLTVKQIQVEETVNNDFITLK